MTQKVANDSQVIQGRVTTRYIVSGKDICKAGWCKVAEVSDKTITSIVQQIAQGQVCC